MEAPTDFRFSDKNIRTEAIVETKLVTPAVAAAGGDGSKGIVPKNPAYQRLQAMQTVMQVFKSINYCSMYCHYLLANN